MFERIKDIIYKIKDYDRLENDYSVLLCHVTDGRLSKTTYDIDRLLTVVNDILYERDEETYKECKKDLALTWEDVKKIEDLCMEIATLFASVGRNKVILEPPFYKEVARRFNEQKKK